MTDRAERLRSLPRLLHDESSQRRTVHDLFQQYVEATPLGILLMDADGTISYTNQSLCRCFGYEPGELIGQSIEVLVPQVMQPDHARLRAAYMAHPTQRLMQGREVRGRRKNGVDVSVAIGLNPLIEGDSLRVACTVVDLTATRQAEEAIASFFDLSIDLFCIASTRGYFLRVNPNFSRLLGYSEQELLSRPFLDFVHPDDVDATQAAVNMLSSGQPVVRFRNRHRQSQGGYLWIEWSARAVPTEELIFAVGRDVTEEVRFEKELLAREQREQALLENTPAVIYIKSVDGKYLYVNQQFGDLFSLDPLVVQGKTDYEIFPRHLADNFVRNDRKVAATASKLTIEERAPHADGLHTYISAKFPLLDANGDVSAVAGISTDITEHIRAQHFYEQLKLATLFQQKLFPGQAPTLARLDLAGAAVPVAHLCGDYYDFIVTGRARVTIAVGDVSGHGLGPALAMVEVRSLLRGMLQYEAENDLVAIIRRLNKLLRDDLPDGCFVSLFLAEIELERGRVRYAGAGHPARIFSTDGAVAMLNSSGPVLGLIDDASYEAVPQVKMNPGDLLLVCTDGVTETMNRQREMFGSQRLIRVVSGLCEHSSADVIENLFGHVHAFADGNPINDDMTAVVAKLVA